VRVSFTVVVADDSRFKAKYVRFGDSNTFPIGLRINKSAFLSELARFGGLPRLVERVRGYPRGTIEDVIEVSIAEAYDGPGSPGY
jgi:hypothetical protein